MNENFNDLKFMILEKAKKKEEDGNETGAWNIGKELGISFEEMPLILQQLAIDGLIEFGHIGSDSITVTELGLSRLKEFIPSRHHFNDLPLGSYLPFLPNPLFTGREDDLKQLAENLLSDAKSGTVITQAVTGMGGLGKTQLAIEFAYLYGKYFRGVHWINLADVTQLDSEIANCGRQMNLPNFPEDQPSQVALTLQTWKTNGPNLIILDNFEEPSQANDILVKLRHSNIRILITSRRTDWSQTLGLSQLQLDLFSPEESLQFLKDSLENKNHSEDEIKNLAERLGHLPLGLELASRYLNGHQRLSISEYLTQTENALNHVSMKNWRVDLPAATGHDLNLQRTFTLSWQELKDETAQKIFMSAGYLAPNTPIPLKIFEKALDISEEKCDEALNVLYGLGLFKEGEDKLPLVHPLLAEYSREITKDENIKTIDMLIVALEVISGELNAKGIPSLFLSIKPHLPILIEHAFSAGLELSSILWTNYGYHLKMVADYIGARKMYERALEIDESNFGHNHPNVSRGLNNLATVLQNLGELSAAKEMYERALKIDEANFGPNHPNVARDINNLASVLQDLGELSAAKEMYERALKIDEANFGPNHPNVARDINNLASVMKALGNLLSAQEMFEQALRIDELIFGPDHPSVAIRLNNLGTVMKDLGNLPSARVMYERALKIIEMNLGINHPNVATLLSNLGSVIQDLGDLQSAETLFKRALAIDEANFDPDHLSIARDVNNLGLVMQASGNLREARKMYERSLEIKVQLLPPDHPSIKITQRNLDSLDEKA